MMHGGRGNDYLDGGWGYDVLLGTHGSDLLYGNLDPTTAQTTILTPRPEAVGAAATRVKRTTRTGRHVPSSGVGNTYTSSERTETPPYVLETTNTPRHMSGRVGLQAVAIRPTDRHAHLRQGEVRRVGNPSAWRAETSTVPVALSATPRASPTT
jgi:Ca2+-binding RTX toxin-like protein